MSKNKEYLSSCLASDSPEVKAAAGLNKIPEAERESLWQRYAEKYKDPLIIILLIALVLSVCVNVFEYKQTGDETLLFEPLGVLFAILLATTVGFVFELKAEKEFKILNQVKDTAPVKVIRRAHAGAEPQVCLVQKCDVVVGDIVRLENGDQVPADGILLAATQLCVDESNFTGELYANKEVEPKESDHQAAYAANRLLRGSVVIEGYGDYRVTAVGVDSEEGRGVMLTQEGSDVETPLNRQLNQLGRYISIASTVFAVLIVVGRLVLFFATGEHLNALTSSSLHIFEYVLASAMIAVTLIVVAVPEGLPMSITISLALSMRKMLKVNNLVRKLHACETMGAATVICTDKTGTLTQNKMRVVAHQLYGGATVEAIARGIAINSTASLSTDEDGKTLKPIGNPTEGALLLWLHDAGIDHEALRASEPVVSQQPFSTETKYMLTETAAHRYIKGAPEVVLAMCDVSDEERQQIEEKLKEYQQQAMRTLAFAMGSTFLGIVGIADPVREDVPQAIHICKDVAGVDVIVVTGDNPRTANVIAQQIGLLAVNEEDKTIVGTDFAAMSDEAIRQRLHAGTIKVIARARPEDKARLVTLLQANGEVVAVTGDGTNDAPALSKAQVGLSMGSGTARAKEASDITIIDDSFSSINKAILWGRSIYLNIRRFIVFQMTINVCACLIVLIGAFIGLDTPLNVTQMLWVNLIMDTFAAMALASLPAEEHVMHDRPRSPKAHIINRSMLRFILGYGLLFTVALLALWQMLYSMDYDNEHGTTLMQYIANHTLTGAHGAEMLELGEHALFFTTFVMLQLWNIGNARYFASGRSFVQDMLDAMHPSRWGKQQMSTGFWSVVILILVGQVVIVQLLPQYFGIAPLSYENWWQIVLLTSPVFILPDLWRFFTSKK